MKLALLGGSFNPIHMGHVALVQSVLSLLDYDRIIVIPASMPPHKATESGMASSEDRLNMVRLALSDHKGLEISTCELDRPGRSYTIDTVSHIYENYQFEGKPGLIMGDDWIGGFAKWKNADELVRLIDPIVAGREGNQKSFPYPCTYLDNDIVSVSSTEIRRKVSRGEDISSMVPHPVADYISRNGLYKEQ